jgi:hypothetical protein
MRSQSSWTWSDTKLAKGDKRSNRVYSVGNCLQRLLPEKAAPAVYTLEEREWLIALIESRFRQRFIRPLEVLIEPRARQAPENYVAVGFTILAIASLMIETLACFRYGQWTTDGTRM